MAALSTDGQLPPLVIRNKRGRKVSSWQCSLLVSSLIVPQVDETLPKSHQREVQRQFRARRAGHLIGTYFSTFFILHLEFTVARCSSDHDGSSLLLLSPSSLHRLARSLLLHLSITSFSRNPIIDLERRVSLLERENIVLRQWAGVLPATRPLLGRGPTGCDTTKPLIADDNDEEVQLILDDSSPHEQRNWPETPTGRTSFVMDQPPQAAHHHHHHQQQQQHHFHQHRIPDTAQGLSNNGQPMSAGGQMMPQLAGGGPSGSYEKGPAGYDQQQPYPDLQRFKPHPLYDHIPPAIVAPPQPASHFDQNSSGVTATDRLLVKRESIYTTPNPSALVPQQQSSQSQQQQQPAATSAPQNHSSLSHGSGYYTVPHRPTFPTQLDRYTGIHTDLNGSYTTSSTWSDPYLQQQQHSSTPTPGQQRRPHPTLMTPVMPSSAGPSSASVASSSPGSATHANSSGATDAAAADPTFAQHHGRGRSVSYAIGVNGSAVNLSSLNANNGSQINLGSTSTSSANAGNGGPASAGAYMPSTAQFGSYHSMDNQEAGNDSFRQ